MAEIGSEKIVAAHEAVAGTPEAAPTHTFPMGGVPTPGETLFEPDENRGVLAARVRSERIKEWADWEGEGGLDPAFAPFHFMMLLDHDPTTTTPVGAVAARLREFVRQMSGNNLKTATAWWGDPLTQVYRAPFLSMTAATIKADGKGDDGTTISWSGVSQPLEPVAPPVYPADVIGGLVVPMDFEVWLDVGPDDVGATQLLGRVLSVEHTIETGQSAKFIPNGPEGPRTFTRMGVGKTAPSTKVEMELFDDDQLALYRNREMVTVRVRHNGALIEAGFWEFIEVDAYGPLRAPGWGDFNSTNRTISFTVPHHYNPVWGTDLIARVQNDQATI